MSAGADGGSRRARLLGALLLLGGLGVGLALCEGALAYLSERDVDGNVYVGWRRLKPYQMPLASTRTSLDLLEQSGFAFEPELGWEPRRGHATDGFVHDARGVRVASAGEVAPHDAAVVLLGDSFVYGAEVPFPGTIGARLEDQLAASGRALHVLNLGASAYGSDQALLRWRKMAPRSCAVVLAFPLMDVPRNVNVLRPLYQSMIAVRPPAGGYIPLSKPRFVPRDGGLKVLNVPTLPPSRVLEVLQDPGNWPLIRHEAFYDPRDYAWTLPRRSRFLSLLANVAEKNRFNHRADATDLTVGLGDERNFFAPGAEARRLMVALSATFAREVKAAGATPLVLYLPSRPEVAAALQGGQGRTADVSALLQEVAAAAPFLDSTSQVVAVARQEGMEKSFMPGHHYAPAVNGAVARALVERLGPELGTCAVPAPQSAGS